LAAHQQTKAHILPKGFMQKQSVKERQVNGVSRKNPSDLGSQWDIKKQLGQII